MDTLVWEFGGARQEVIVEPGALGRAGDVLARGGGHRPALLVSDSNVAPLYAAAVRQSLEAAGLRCDLAVVPAGESSKSLTTLGTLFDRMAALGLGRGGAVLALGGGMITDLAGLAAATWQRGVELVNCPTSLEGAIDAALGGKTGVNHASGKNLIGAFHPASSVLIDPGCLGTLPRREFVAGLAESLKHALIEDEAFLTWHESARDAILAADPAAMAQLIRRNVQIKMGIVVTDPRETGGARMRLNFGHTAGHAIEAACGYTLRHGECVSLGMVAAARLSQRLSLLSAAECERIERAIAAFGLPLSWAALPSPQPLMEFVARDKKAAGPALRWVLLDGIGRTVIRDDVPPRAVEETLQSLTS